MVVGRRAPASSHSHCTGAGAGANKRKQFRKDLNVCSACAAGPLHPSWFTCLALKLHFGVSKSEKETSSLRPAADPRPMPAWIQSSETEFNGIFSFQDDDHYDKRDVPSLSKRAKTDEGLPPPAPTPPDPYAAMAMYYSKLQSSFRPWSPKGGFPPLAGYPLPHPFSQRVNSLPENALEIRRPEEINHRPPSSLERFRSESESPQGSSKRKLEKGNNKLSNLLTNKLKYL